MIKYFLALLSLTLAGPAFAGPLDSLKAYSSLSPDAFVAPAAPAPAAAEQRGSSELTACYERDAKDSIANDGRLPLNFCVSRVTLERTAQGNLKMGLTSGNKEIVAGPAEYIFENGAMKYARVQAFDFFNEIYMSAIFLSAPVYPNGNLIPGAELKVQAKSGFLPPAGDWLMSDVIYSKPKPPQPPAVSGSCFLRAPQAWADEAGMPAKFCVKAAALVREDNGGLKLDIQGEVSGSFKAEYLQRNDKTFVKAVLFDRETGGMEAYSGTVTLLLPVLPSGDLAAKGQALVEAQAGYNWDVYHSHFQYQPVKYYTVAD